MTLSECSYRTSLRRIALGVLLLLACAVSAVPNNSTMATCRPVPFALLGLGGVGASRRGDATTFRRPPRRRRADRTVRCVRRNPIGRSVAATKAKRGDRPHVPRHRRVAAAPRRPAATRGDNRRGAARRRAVTRADDPRALQRRRGDPRRRSPRRRGVRRVSAGRARTPREQAARETPWRCPFFVRRATRARSRRDPAGSGRLRAVPETPARSPKTSRGPEERPRAIPNTPRGPEHSGSGRPRAIPPNVR